METSTKKANQAQASHIPMLSLSEIDMLLAKLARGHLSTGQEEYADLKKALAP